ncbi:MAG: hypothetical protein ABW321_34145 [Polyangiales bacterium]
MTETAASELCSLINDSAPAERIASFLDGLRQPARIDAVRGLSVREQRRLWARAEGFAALSIPDVVPSSLPVLVPVRHYGRNSLPAFTLFEKRFYREADGERYAGANFQAVSPLTGPGYFALREDPARREVLVDYTQLPATKPAGWPEIVPNERGLSRFVFGAMVDTLRRVSTHVTIGRAARKGKAVDAWFVLCRDDAA